MEISTQGPGGSKIITRSKQIEAAFPLQIEMYGYYFSLK